MTPPKNLEDARPLRLDILRARQTASDPIPDRQLERLTGQHLDPR